MHGLPTLWTRTKRPVVSYNPTTDQDARQVSQRCRGSESVYVDGDGILGTVVRDDLPLHIGEAC